jgi:flagellar hook protein FlgE
MSISSALLAGVTGLVSNSSSLAATSDNIANSNTIGYKRVGVDFSSMVNTGSGSDYAAGGVTSSTHAFVTTQGTLQATSSPTDLAISGNGFFVVTGVGAGLTPFDPRYFTRAGDFTVDQKGYLKNAANLYLQGWPADAKGNVTPDSANLSTMVPINIEKVANIAEPTSEAAIQGNLNSDEVINPNIANYLSDLDPAAPGTNVNMAQYALDPTTGVKPDFSITLPISDSKGGQRNVVVDFLKSSTPNQWYAEVRSDPPNDVDVDPNLTPGLIASGIVAFKPDGTFDAANSTFPTTITLGASSSTPPAAGSGEAGVQWANALGVNGQSINLDLAGISQFSSTSAVSNVTTDGTAFGSVAGVSIDPNGDVTAVYANGTTRKIAQVAIATFPNPDGLRSVNGNAYQVSLQSGAFTLKPPGAAGAGTVSPSSLEASTVDLSTEFTNLITTQRAYSASSKIITTADQMLQELLTIKQ